MNWYVHVLKNYAVFNGRARRKEYWMYSLFTFIAAIILFTVSDLLGTIYLLGTCIPTLAVGIRRLHDTNRSGWWMLLQFVPLIGSIVLLVFFMLDSTQSDNQYGPNPKEPIKTATVSLEKSIT